MESIIWEHSPVADYLEGQSHHIYIYISTGAESDLLAGQGEAENEWTSAKMSSEPTSPSQKVSFAPRGLASRYNRIRRKPPRLLNLGGSASKGFVSRLYGTYSVLKNFHSWWRDFLADESTSLGRRAQSAWMDW